MDSLSSPTRVLLCDENKGFGGAERHVVTLAGELHKTESLTAVAARKTSWLASNCDDLPVFHVGYRNEVDMVSVFTLYRKLKSSRANVVHCIGHRDLVAGALALQLPGAPKCVLLKAEHSYPDAKLSSLFRWAYGQVHAITSVSAELETAVRSTVKPGPGVHLQVIPNGIPLEHPPRKKAPDGALHIGVLSPLRAGKGQGDFLRAAANVEKRHPDKVNWSLAGDGDQKEQLQQLASELNLKVDFLGHLNNPNEYLDRLHLSVVPSHRETFSLVTLESLLLGCPVLAANSGGVSELCHEQTGAQLYSVGNVNELTEALQQFVLNPETAQQRAIDGCDGVREKFSSRAMLTSYQALYEELLARLPNSAR